MNSQNIQCAMNVYVSFNAMFYSFTFNGAGSYIFLEILGLAILNSFI